MNFHSRQDKGAASPAAVRPPHSASRNHATSPLSRGQGVSAGNSVPGSKDPSAAPSKKERDEKAKRVDDDAEFVHPEATADDATASPAKSVKRAS